MARTPAALQQRGVRATGRRDLRETDPSPPGCRRPGQDRRHRHRNRSLGDRRGRDGRRPAARRTLPGCADLGGARWLPLHATVRNARQCEPSRGRRTLRRPLKDLARRQSYGGVWLDDAAGTKTSAVANELPSDASPPMISTRPSRSAVPVWAERGTVIGAVGKTFPVVGSITSTLRPRIRIPSNLPPPGYGRRAEGLGHMKPAGIGHRASDRGFARRRIVDLHAIQGNPTIPAGARLYMPSGHQDAAVWQQVSRNVAARLGQVALLAKDVPVVGWSNLDAGERDIAGVYSRRKSLPGHP